LYTLIQVTLFGLIRNIGPGEVPLTTTDSRVKHPCVMFLTDTRREKSGLNEASCALTTAACTVKQEHRQMITSQRVNMMSG